MFLKKMVVRKKKTAVFRKELLRGKRGRRACYYYEACFETCFFLNGACENDFARFDER